MPVTPAQPELQLRTLRLYGELLCRRASWSHLLALACFEGAAASGLAAAASLAGAASLVVDADTSTMKAHFRDGAYDFVVNTLDEALRAIKNEVRQGHPIAIGLMAEPAKVLAEATARGLAAAFVLRGEEQSVQELRGVAAVDAAVSGPGDEPSDPLAAWLAERQWVVAEVSGAAVPEDAVMQKWMRDLPALQRSVRQAERWGWMLAASVNR